MADVVIDNTGDLPETLRQVDRFYASLLRDEPASDDSDT